jgi:hypothetical protein
LSIYFPIFSENVSAAVREEGNIVVALRKDGMVGYDMLLCRSQKGTTERTFSMEMGVANRFVAYGEIGYYRDFTEVAPWAGCGDIRTVWYGEF